MCRLPKVTLKQLCPSQDVMGVKKDSKGAHDTSQLNVRSHHIGCAHAALAAVICALERFAVVKFWQSQGTCCDVRNNMLDSGTLAAFCQTPRSGPLLTCVSAGMMICQTAASRSAALSASSCRVWRGPARAWSAPHRCAVSCCISAAFSSCQCNLQSLCWEAISFKRPRAAFRRGHGLLRTGINSP